MKKLKYLFYIIITSITIIFISLVLIDGPVKYRLADCLADDNEEIHLQSILQKRGNYMHYCHVRYTPLFEQYNDLCVQAINRQNKEDMDFIKYCFDESILRGSWREWSNP